VIFVNINHRASDIRKSIAITRAREISGITSKFHFEKVAKIEANDYLDRNENLKNNKNSNRDAKNFVGNARDGRNGFSSLKLTNNS
jgi:hypothetical protein